MFAAKNYRIRAVLCRFRIPFVMVVMAVIILLVFKEKSSPKWVHLNRGISGMALVERSRSCSSYLVVHDFKKKNEGRLAIINVDVKNKVQYSPLNWPDNVDLPIPIDLEAVTSLPEKDVGSFMVLTSGGEIYHIRLDTDESSISIDKKFSLPDISNNDNFEGFVLNKLDGKLLAVWAHRGSDDQPAIIYWGILDLRTYEISPINSADLKVPWPKDSNVRHISEMKITHDKFLFISSASDPGDEGPFKSAVYIAGRFRMRNNKIDFQQNHSPVNIFSDEKHKIEAFEFLSNGLPGMIFASDDEKEGGSIYMADNSAMRIRLLYKKFYSLLDMECIDKKLWRNR